MNMVQGHHEKGKSLRWPRNSSPFV